MSLNDVQRRIWLMDQHGRHVEAEAHVRELLAERPDDPWGLHMLSLVLERQGREEEALEVARRGCVVAPDWEYSWIRVAGILARRNDPPGAVEAAERAVACAPHVAEAHHALSTA